MQKNKPTCYKLNAAEDLNKFITRLWSESWRAQEVQAYHLTIFWGVKLDSQRWFKMAPFHVALNRISHSDLVSVSEETPAGPTNIKCWTCSGCCSKRKVASDIPVALTLAQWFKCWEQYSLLITLRAYLAATYPPKECPSNIKLLRFLAFRHSSKESMNHASVSIRQR